MLDPKTESALDRMSELEKAVSRLYALYASRFPSHRGLWAALSAEETEHAEWIRDLAGKVRDGHLQVSAGRFKTKTVETALNSVEKHILDAESGKPSALDSLSAAVALESSLLEKDFFRIHVEDSAEMKSTLDRLAAATENHRAKIQQAWRAARSEAGL